LRSDGLTLFLNESHIDLPARIERSIRPFPVNRKKRRS
jgi:hypothetical protein